MKINRMKINRNVFLEEILKTKGNKGTQYCKYSGLNFNFDWCAIFTSYIMREIAGIKDFPKSTSCTQIKNSPFAIPKKNMSFKTAEVGDIILFELNNPSDGPDHIGIVVENSNGIISVLEGNTGCNDFNNSYVSVNQYSFTSRVLDCIIDMSEYFTDEFFPNIDDEFFPKKEKEQSTTDNNKIIEVFRKIKELLLSVEI